MAVTLTKVGKTPGQPQFGLDTFTERYKCDATADVVLTDGSVPQKGSAHPSYAFMFLTDRYCVESGESASALDLVYTGCLASSGGAPVLPPQQHIDSDAVQSATSSKSNTGIVVVGGLTIQYYAPMTELSFITYGAKGTRGTVADPSDDVRVITVKVGDQTYTPTGILSDIVSQFFSPLIVGTISSPEIVAGKYWNNTDRKTKTLAPFLFSANPGDYITMFSPGTGYSVGNTLTMNDGSGHTASITVATTGISNSIVTFTVGANSFNYTTPAPINASGGSGSGAAFYNTHVT